jgi:hypothetical protein
LIEFVIVMTDIVVLVHVKLSLKQREQLLRCLPTFRTTIDMSSCVCGQATRSTTNAISYNMIVHCEHSHSMGHETLCGSR